MPQTITEHPCERDVAAVQTLLEEAPTGAYLAIARAGTGLQLGKAATGTWILAGSYWAPGEPMGTGELALLIAEKATSFGLADTPDQATSSWARVYRLPPVPA